MLRCTCNVFTDNTEEVKTLTVLCWSIPSKIPVRLENTGLSVGSAFQHFCITAYLYWKLVLYMLYEKRNSYWFGLSCHCQKGGVFFLAKNCWNQYMKIKKAGSNLSLTWTLYVIEIIPWLINTQYPREMKIVTVRIHIYHFS